MTIQDLASIDLPPAEQDLAERSTALVRSWLDQAARITPDAAGQRLAGVLREVQAPAADAAGPRDDGALLRAVIAAMREQPWTDTFWVYPDVAAGVVTLYGYARSEALRTGLRLLAQDIPGVVRVEDKLQPMPLILRAAL